MTAEKTIGALAELLGSPRDRLGGIDPSAPVKGVCYNSKSTVPGGLFVAVKGAAADGHDYIMDAISKGALAVVAQKTPSVPLPGGAALLIVEDSRGALAAIADWYYGSPTSEMSVTGVTGTNGKTTTTYIISAVMNAAGRACGKIGTIGYDSGGKTIPLDNTTPECLDVQRILRQMKDGGAVCCAMEVSSHALEQGRVNGVRFSTAVFTNLTQDHLDYHGSMEKYFEAKARLFAELSPRTAVINMDDPYGRRLVKMTSAPVITYGLSPEADVRAEDVTVSVDGVAMTLKTPSESIAVRSNLTGRHNVYNLLAAAAAACAEKVSLSSFAQGAAALACVPGRFERVDAGQPFAVIVDYAHTPDALEKTLTTARSLAEGKIITVFGCGGDRDRKKRPLMGRAAWTLSDHVVVTSDNPRTEDPEKIIEEILGGINREENRAGALEVIPDRREAIRAAARAAREGDLLLIAGKGHEDYQIVGRVKSHFDDREEARKAVMEAYGKVRR
ncbi:MAG: UDP-N-acetylmuramoyl-L-alanyl-D-glutamate--2,6-diaminopimelate ligase [Nitrospinae bacterium]|nr:UDP-N-acetylmuramoyl-L-alanyl-D-glutamate--2,6-diaminopimelate ligase [Nitrospinota bacterium]